MITSEITSNSNSSEVTIHKLSDVQSESIGKRTTIWQFSIVLEKAVIGCDCNICSHVFIENDVVIGDRVTIKSGVQVWDGVTIENDVFIGPNVTFTNDLLPRSKQYPSAFERTILSHNCSVGANTTIVAGHVVGAYAMIGAGSVVTKDIGPYELWYGNPAQHKGYITQENVALNLEKVDVKTGNKYLFDNNGWRLAT